ncbi:MAG: L-2-amino-thiazoline-4-carboxylic acid hydrolase [SAR324 cluster bacterium]|nr:L-2-amino-thiazoline-4-carboxylic acid hydrolase [SAR324 cluster bacterium]
MTQQSISILEQRRIEAGVIKPLMEAFEAELGREKSRAILSRVIKEQAREKGRQMAAEAPDTTLAGFASLKEPWYRDGALEMDILEESADRYDFNVTRCRYAEMYREMGLGDLGFILSCDRDATRIEGFNPELRLKRTQTIMQGSDCCDFRYSRKDQD